MNGKGDAIALTQGHDFCPRLHARALLGQNEFSASEISLRFREQNGHLDWEYMLAVEILMEAVVVPLFILQ